MESVKESIKEFLQSSSIHGLVYISTGKRYLRLIWLCVVIAGFSVAGVLIQQSFSSWGASPVTTTLETLPISELDFPNVTVCPPRNTFTSFIPDLVRSRNMTLQLNETEWTNFNDFISYAAYDANYKARLRHFEGYRQSEHRDLYSGVTKMDLPHLTSESEYSRNYELYTTSFNGSFSTPYFNQAFESNTFEKDLKSGVNISVPEGLTTYLYYNGYSLDDGWIYILIEYDMERTSSEEYIYVMFDSNSEDQEDIVELDRTQSRKELNYPAGNIESFHVSYDRHMDNGYYGLWTNKRNTGMRVTWYYYSHNAWGSDRTLQLFTAENVGADARYVEENRYFVQLANIIHEHGVTKEMEKTILNYKMTEAENYEFRKYMIMNNQLDQSSINCSLREVNWMLGSFDISNSSIYSNEITEETLQVAASIYFANVFCPDYDPEISKFYINLIRDFPLETSLRKGFRKVH